jgi:DNA-binding MarR family transcriptional regulator
MPMRSHNDPSICSATALRKATRRVTQLYDNALAPAGLTVNQYSLLVELSRDGKRSPTVTELAALMVMDRSGLGHTLGPLIRDGYISLALNPADARSRQVVITAKGKALRKKASPLWSRAQEKFRATVGNAYAAELQSALLSIAHDDRLEM